LKLLNNSKTFANAESPHRWIKEMAGFYDANAANLNETPITIAT